MVFLFSIELVPLDSNNIKFVLLLQILIRMILSILRREVWVEGKAITAGLGFHRRTHATGTNIKSVCVNE